MQITIKGYTFHLSAPYDAGTVITKGEAQALNALRAENIQNNLRKLVNDATGGLAPDELLSAEAHAALQAKFSEYDASYQFLERKIGGRLGDIDAEAQEIARERIEAGFRRDGLAPPSESAMAELIAQQASLPAVQEEARKRVSARRRVLGEGLESLI